jgi:hypothetical protein
MISGQQPSPGAALLGAAYDRVIAIAKPQCTRLKGQIARAISTWPPRASDTPTVLTAAGLFDPLIQECG